jgi:hypothetical protein
MRRLKRIQPMSAFKMGGALYALMGLLFGALISLISVVGTSMTLVEKGVLGVFFGAMAIIVLPIVYGLIGAVFSAIAALLYNLVARFVGGLVVEVE